MKSAGSWFELDQEQLLRNWALEVSLESILRMQGADGAEVLKRNTRLKEMAGKALAYGSPLLQPVVLFKVLRVDQLHHERLMLDHGKELKSRLLAEHFKSAGYIVTALCTIGDGVEQAARASFKQEPVFSLALEGLGSAAVEALATEFCALVERNARGAGMASSIPLSPGMVGWPVAQGQQQIFDILDGSLVGVKLTQSSMMRPVKTISLMIGVGAEIASEGSTCDFCSMRERCHYRDHYIDVHKS